jgi:hypothetical protein
MLAAIAAPSPGPAMGIAASEAKALTAAKAPEIIVCAIWAARFISNCSRCTFLFSSSSRLFSSSNRLTRSLSLLAASFFSFSTSLILFFCISICSLTRLRSLSGIED